MGHPIRIRAFRLYWMGQIISLSGGWMQHLAQSWLVYILTNSPLSLGFVSFLSSLPVLLFSLFAGVVADRYSRKDIIVTVQMLAMIPSFTVGILIQGNLIKFWHIAVASFVSGIAVAFDMPARHAFVSEIVPKDMITSAIAMQSISFNVARIAGPFMAGLVISHYDFHVCFYLNGLSFLPLIFILRGVVFDSIKQPFLRGVEMGPSVAESLKEGLKFFMSQKFLRNLICAVGVFTIFGMSVLTVVPVIVDRVLHRGAEGMSLVFTCIGCGSLAAATIIALRGHVRREKEHLFKASLLLSLSILGLGISESLFFALFFSVSFGFAFVNVFTVSNSFVQQNSPVTLRGRMMSFFGLVFLGFSPLGNLLVGTLMEHFAIKFVIVIYAAICLVSSFLLLRTAAHKTCA